VSSIQQIPLFIQFHQPKHLLLIKQVAQTHQDGISIGVVLSRWIQPFNPFIWNIESIFGRSVRGLLQEIRLESTPIQQNMSTKISCFPRSDTHLKIK
jgi:hypothetical protein